MFVVASFLNCCRLHKGILFVIDPPNHKYSIKQILCLEHIYSVFNIMFSFNQCHCDVRYNHKQFCVYNSSCFQWIETHIEMIIFVFSASHVRSMRKHDKKEETKKSQKIMTKPIRLHANTMACNQCHMAVRVYTFDSISIQTKSFESLTR